MAHTLQSGHSESLCCKSSGDAVKLACLPGLMRGYEHWELGGGMWGFILLFVIF